MKQRNLLLIFLMLTGHCIYKPEINIDIKYGKETPRLLIKGGILFSGKAEESLKQVDILIVNGRIEKIGAGLSDPSAVVVDAGGKTIIPALIDLHTHLVSAGTPPWLAAVGSVENNARAYLFAGITTVQDLMGNPEDINDYIRDFSGVKPRIYHAGKAFTVANGHPAALIEERLPWPIDEFIMNKLLFRTKDSDNIPALLAENRKNKATVTKVFMDQIPLGIPEMPEDLAAKIATVSNGMGMPVFAHVGTEEEMLGAVRAGIKYMAHLPYRSAVSAQTIALLRKNEITILSTMVVFDSIARLYRKDMKFSGMAKQIYDTKVQASYADTAKMATLNRDFTGWLKVTAENKKVKFNSLCAMLKAGVNVVAASDSPNVGVPPGEGLHRELQLWVEHCGTSPIRALQAATYLPGKVLEKYSGLTGLGYLHEGSPADLLIIGGDINSDIQSVSRVEKVFMNGREILRKPETTAVEE